LLSVQTSSAELCSTGNLKTTAGQRFNRTEQQLKLLEWLVLGPSHVLLLPASVAEVVEAGKVPAEVWALLNGAQWAQGVQGMIRTSLPSFSCCHQCCRSYRRRSPWMFNLGRTLTGGQLHPGRPGPRSAPRCPRAPLQGRSW